jgi:hypothetical protein
MSQQNLEPGAQREKGRRPGAIAQAVLSSVLDSGSVGQRRRPLFIDLPQATTESILSGARRDPQKFQSPEHQLFVRYVTPV